MSGASTVTNGATVTVRTNSASTYSTQACATLKIGGPAAQFCVTTMAETTYATISVQSKGRGSGYISSGTASGTCQTVCSASVASGTTVSLRATPAAGSVFTGWLGACTGTGNCNVSVRGNVIVSATFAASSPDGLLLDVDENGTVNGSTDGAIIQHYMSDGTGTAMTESFIGANALVTTPTAITDYLKDIEPLLDIDGDGIVDSATDGELLSRYLRGVRKGALISGAVGPGATRTSWKEIEGQIAILLEAVKP